MSIKKKIQARRIQTEWVQDHPTLACVTARGPLHFWRHVEEKRKSGSWFCYVCNFLSDSSQLVWEMESFRRSLRCFPRCFGCLPKVRQWAHFTDPWVTLTCAMRATALSNQPLSIMTASCSRALATSQTAWKFSCDPHFSPACVRPLSFA